jgi:hypothetical protein
MSEDPWDDPALRRYAKRCRDELVPMIKDSGTCVSILPEGEPDIKFAVELGLMIMLDKPIVALVRPGTKVPFKLIAVADAIVEGDIDDPTVKTRLMAAIHQANVNRPFGSVTVTDSETSSAPTETSEEN